jgi:hypothetical protein
MARAPPATEGLLFYGLLTVPGAVLTGRLRRRTDTGDEDGTDARGGVPTFVGLVLGIMIGLLIGPVVRSWLSWREYEDARREARLSEDVLRLMSEQPPPSGELPQPSGSRPPS